MVLAEEFPEIVIQYHGRHGRTPQNTSSNFDGGGHDDGPEGPIPLDEVGERQIEATSYMAQILELPISGIYNSPQNRTVQSAQIFVDKHPGLSENNDTPGMQEVDWGTIQRLNPKLIKGDEKPIRAKSIAATVLALSRLPKITIEDRELIHRNAEWVAPMGADGELPVQVGIRVTRSMDEYGHQEGALFMGHNGGGRTARMFAGALTRGQRKEVGDLYHKLGVAERLAESKAAIKPVLESAHLRNRLTVAELSDHLRPLAGTLMPIVRLLGKCGIPVMDDTPGAITRVDNGTIGEVGVLPNGRWVRGRLWTPEFPPDVDLPLRLDIVRPKVVASSWL